jgi:putative endonuclease
MATLTEMFGMKTKQIIELIGNCFHKTPKAAHLVTGEVGEVAAMHYLMQRKYYIVARQWRCGKAPGDLDMVARKVSAETGESLLCFVEVKTRSKRDETPAHIAVDHHKRQTLRRLARQYLTKLAKDDKPAIRFDIISVYLDGKQGPEFEHFEGAFGWKDHPRNADHWN